MLSRTVEVQIDVVDRSNKPPVWDQTIYGPIYVKENTAVGETVTTVKARSVLCPPKIPPKKMSFPQKYTRGKLSIVTTSNYQKKCFDWVTVTWLKGLMAKPHFQAFALPSILFFLFP